MEDITKQILDPKELVQYQDGSVVSRALVQKKTGSITLFAFDQGQGLSEHTAPYDATVQILDGEADITIGGDPFHLKTGESIIMPANIPHALDAKQRFKMMLIMIHE
jgi:quercetin dioxygenase-like cupin family protein